MKFIVHIQDGDLGDATPEEAADCIHEAIRNETGSFARVYAVRDTALEVDAKWQVG